MIDFELHWPTVVVFLALELVAAYLYGFVKGCISEWRKRDE